MRVRYTRWAVTLAALFVAVAVAAPAADAKKRRKKKGAKVQKMTAGGPQLRYEQFRRKIEFKVAEKREEQIEGIEKLLGLGPDESEVPDLKFRLAELFYEKSRFFFFRAQEANDKKLRASSDSEKAQLAADEEQAMRESKQWLGRAMDIYREIRERFPKYERTPEVLFALGQSYWNEGRFQDAINIYRDLIVSFEGSPLVSEAWIAFGEYYFQEGDVNRALKSYEKAAEDKRSRVYGFALYKQAWCYYNMSEWKEALRKFKATVFYSDLAEELSGENKIALGREATKDFVRTYSHIGDDRRAKFVFADLLGKDDCSGDKCLTMLEQLAGLWFDEGYFQESASLYRQLIEARPQDTKNAFFQGRVVDLVSRGGNKKKVIAETRKLVKLYEDTRARVASGGTDKDKEHLEEARRLAETTMRRLAQIWNREAKKTRNDETYGYARTMYEDYLKLFGDTKYAYEMTFQLGDLYYKLERFDDAAKAYEATVKADPKGQYVVQAANDSILAIEEHIKDLGVRPPKTLKGEMEIHPQKRRLIEACDRYVAVVPEEKAKKLVAVKLKAARILYNWGHNQPALERFEAIVEAHPSSKQAEIAANLVIDIYNQREDWQRLYDASAKYRANDALVEGRPTLLMDLSKFGEYAKFKLVSILEERVKKENGDLRLVAQAYQDFHAEFPKSDNADKALYNASVAWDQAGQKEKAQDMRRTLLEDYPDSPLNADVAFYVAKRQEERTDFEAAAKGFLNFHAQHPDDERARDALYNAAVFYAGIGRVRTATKLREKYLKLYGRAKGGEKEAATIYWAIAQDLDRAGRYRQAADRYRDFAREFPQDDRFWDALWREADIRKTRLRQGRQAEKIERTILGTYLSLKKKRKKIPDNAKRYASQVAFELLDERYAKYARLRVKTPNVRNPKPFQRSLKDKASAREQVIKDYTGIVTEYQQAESTVASLYKIAKAWDEFVETLEGVPCPRGVDANVCGKIKEGIEQFALPARESAYQAYKACVDKSNQLNTFTRYSTRCVKALETLAPEAYPQIVEKSMDFSRKERLRSLEPNPLILEYDGYQVAKEAQAGVSEPEAKR